MRVVAALAVCAAAALVCGCGADSRPSILLVTWDTTRADRVGAYGNEARLTPNLDRLARSGVVFEHCVTPIGTTVPSHSTMLTGLLPGSHGVRENQQQLAGHVPVVAEALSASGYATGAFVALRLLLTQAGLHRGFERVSDPAGVVARNLSRDDDEVLDLAVVSEVLGYFVDSQLIIFE